jgi:hypothetical protein
MGKGVEITGTLASRSTERGLWRGVALLVLQFPLPKLPARREISNAIVLGFALRTDRSYDLRFNSRVAFWACVEMREWWRVKALFGKGVARFGGGKSQMLQPQRLRKAVNSQSLTRASSKIYALECLN